MLGGVADDRDDDDADESLGDPECRTYVSIVPTKNSESNATNPVATSKTIIALPRDQDASFFLQLAFSALKEMPVCLDEKPSTQK